MAKAAAVGIHPEMAFSEAAARTVAVRAEELWRHSENVLDVEDIERVHDMRVATRRLRAVLEIFAPCFPAKPHAKALKEVKALADALGERRDPDVQLALLAELGFEDDPFALTLRARQVEGNAALAAALRHAEERDLRGMLERLVEKVA
jgi:CHAD domain-containing protein